MPAVLSFPGVYIDELPSGAPTIAGVPTAICAFLGRSISGPVNEPQVLNSFGDFERTFGGLAVGYPATYAVRDFFLNGGGQALFVRLYNQPVLASPPTSPPGSSNGIARIRIPHNVNAAQHLNLRAASPGAWGNNLRVGMVPVTDAAVAAALGLPAGTLLFDLVVKYPDTATVAERVRNLAFADNARRVDRVLANQSSLIRWDNLGVAGAVPPLPADLNFRTTSGSPPAPIELGVLDAGGAPGADSQPITDFIGSESAKTGLNALEKADLFNLLCIPPDTQEGNLPLDHYARATAYCVKRRAMFIIDAPNTWTSVTAVNLATLNVTGPDARNAVAYFPRVAQPNPLRGGQLETFVPCGAVAGVIASTDARRGVFKAPAGLDAPLVGVRGLSVTSGEPFAITDPENGQLNPLGVNCLRTFPIAGSVVWGARTLRGADQLADDYKYVPVRRLVLFIEESLYRGTKFAVFEPNDEPLWSQLRLSVGAFMQNLFRQGAFQGGSPREAYFVKVDSETTTQNDINLGIVNVVVGFAPLKPAEFVVIKIQQIAGQVGA